MAQNWYIFYTYTYITSVGLRLIEGLDQIMQSLLMSASTDNGIIIFLNEIIPTVCLDGTLRLEFSSQLAQRVKQISA